MNIEQFRYVFEVARQGSFSSAAAELYVSQPTLSAAVKKLEESLGEPLFIRHNTGVSLTPFGEATLPYIKDVLDTISQMPTQAYGRNARGKPRLTVANGGFAYMTSAIARVYEAHKEDGLCIDCYDVSREKSLDMVATGAVQVGGYGIFNFQREQLSRRLESKGVTFYPLAICGPTAAVGPNHPLFNRKEDWVTLDMIKPYPLIHNFSDHSTALFKRLGLLNSFNIITCSERAGRRELLDLLDCVSISSVGGMPYRKIGYNKNRRIFQLRGVDYTTELGYIVRTERLIPPIANELILHIRDLFL